MNAPDPTEFNPHSLNATLARIIANQEEESRKSDAILAQAIKTNGRVSMLETWREVITGKMAIVSSGVATIVSVAAWALNHFLG